MYSSPKRVNTRGFDKTIMAAVAGIVKRDAYLTED